MKAAQSIGQLKEKLAVYWLARTEQERKYLTVGGIVVLLALVYMFLIDPALTGRDALSRQLPQLRQDAATLQAMAVEASQLSSQQVPQPVPMTRESLMASLAARSITPPELTTTGEYAKLRVANVSFANLVMWLDAQRRENRISVQDMTVTPVAQAAPGQVDASITLHQDMGTATR